MNRPGKRLGSAAALLQKASSQLRGEKIEKPEDELNAYISSLTQKTVKSQKSVNFEDLGDSISISSDIEDVQNKPEAVGSSASKFLKKSPAVQESASSPASGASKFLKKPQASTGSPAIASATPKPSYGAQSLASSGGSLRPGSQQSGMRASSSALDKMTAITGKIQQRAASRKRYTLESDSDESFSAIKISGSGADQISESQTSDSFKIGKDGGKFLKKATPTPAASIEPPIQSKANQAKQAAQNQTQQNKASPFTLKSSMKYSTDVVLTSEEESLAEFVGGLPSSSDSMEKPRGRNYKRTTPQRSPSPQAGGKGSKVRQASPASPVKHTKQTSKTDKNRSPSPQNKPPLIARRTPSPSPRSPSLRRRSPSPKLMRSYSDDSNYADSIQDEVVEDFDTGMNVIMDLDDLGPAVEDVHSLRNAPLTGSKTSSRKSSKSPSKSSQSKDAGSPFKASQESSPFKTSGKGTAQSPFKATTEVNDSPFKAKASNNERSVFSAGGDRGSPFKAANKENKSDYGSPFRASNEGSPFRSSNEAKPSDKSPSPFFNPTPAKKPTKKTNSSPFKAPPIRTASPYSEKSDSRSARQKNKKNKKTRSKKPDKKTTSSGGGNDIFSTLGIQTVEDLLGAVQSESKASAEYEDMPSAVDEVTSQVSEEIRTEKAYNVSRYSSRYNESVTELVTEIEESRPSGGQTYTDDFDSISEKIGYSSGGDLGRSSASEVRTKYSGEDTITGYTDYSDTETDTYTRSKTVEDTYSYTSYTEDFSKSVVPTTTPALSRSDATPRPKRGMIHTQVQTTADGLHYSWDQTGSGMAYPSVPYGLHFVDPTPIAAHVVSADALEAMTAYSPAMLALHDMLKSQLELTREFVSMQQRLYTDTSNSIQPTYHYTTLEDTKKYIKKHKKKKMTFKEALQLVDLETARS